MTYETIGKILSILSTISWTLELTVELVSFALLLCFFGLSNLEARFPRIKRPVNLTRQSYRINLGLFVFNSLLMSICSVSSLYLIAGQFSDLGLLTTVPSVIVKVIASFLAFDFLLYGWHRICHNVDAFWLFHRVHHNDPHLNVSTAFRLHFVEVLLTNSLKALLIILLGIDKTTVLLIEAFSTFCIMLHHCNVGFRHERSLSYLIVVPYLHRVHHSTERNEHDSNYGAVLSIWDILFRTRLELKPEKIGINGKSPQDLFGLIKFGLGLDFPTSAQPANLEVMIAEAAYYKAEKRNFRPGDDMRDWLEAKAEILSQVCGNSRKQRNRQLNW